MDKTNLNMPLIKISKRFSSSLFILFASFLLATTAFSADPAAKPADAAAAPAASGTAAPAAGGTALGDAAKGQTLFQQNCKQCHAPDKQVVGPALRGISKRRPIEWIVSFVQNSAKVIASGDQYANDIYNKFQKTQMPSHAFLSPDDIKGIVAYIETAPSEAAATPAGGATGGAGGISAAQQEDNTLLFTLVIIVLVLVVIVLVLVLAILRKYLKDKETSLNESDREIVNQKFELGKVLKSKAFIAIVSIIFVCYGVKSCWVGLLSVGVEQNYKPHQPIPFSHKLHAGQYKINCNYCHTGVKDSKSANIPSVNICMNCHTYIKSGPKYGEAGIKILLEHVEGNTPIKWIRVHNLPDLAYFNHSQHVKVGGVDCAKCHGQIDTMEVVQQVTPLTMGFCINCHRETAINGKDNAYYDKLYAAHKSKDLTVEQIGGTECSKCHY